MLALPQAIDRLRNVIVEMDVILRSRQLEPGQQIKLEVFAAMMNSQKYLAAAHAELDSLLQTRIQFHARSKMLAILLSLFGVFLFIVIAWVFANRLAKVFRAMAEGSTGTADRVIEVANSITGASGDLSSSSLEQAAAIQETSAAINETTSMIAKSAENSNKSADVSRISQATAVEGLKATQAMMDSMEEIERSTNEIRSFIEKNALEFAHISKVIADIGSKTQVINEIVFQAKLLSFNASVEATRAGEHGKGFAVVADEVGKLAQMSGSAAQEISGMLDSSIIKVDEIVKSTQTKMENILDINRQKLEVGKSNSHRCKDVIEEIVSNASGVGEMILEISHATQEQAPGITEINKAMNEIDHSAKLNSSTSQKTAAFSAELKEQVVELRNEIRDLEKIVYGDVAA